MTAGWEAAQMAVQTSWCLAQWWTVSQRVSPVEERVTDGLLDIMHCGHKMQVPKNTEYKQGHNMYWTR